MAAVALFALSRAFLLGGFEARSSDVFLYASYAMEHELAARAGETLYQFHAEQHRRALEEAQLGWRDPPARGSDVIEYPPLAVAIILAPAAFVSMPPGPRFVEAYAAAFRSLMALADALGFALVWILVARLFPSETPRERALRLGLYAAGSFLLAHVLYDRLDVVVAVSMLAALTLMLGRARPVWGLAALAFAIHVKLVPVLLAPVLLLAVARGSRAALARHAAGLAALVGALLVPFVLAWGPACLGFLRYHGARGVQIESTYATVLLALGRLGLPTRVVLEFGAADVLSPLAPAFARVSPVLVAAAVIALGVSCWRRRAVDGPAVAGYALATLVAAMAVSKVLSNQYVIWLVPMVALAPLPARPRHALFAGFLVMCALTAAIFPYLYFDDVVGRGYVGPTALGLLALAARNVLLVGIAIIVCRRAAR